MAVQLSEVLTTARTYLNDDNASMFPDPVLIPKIQVAHKELQTKLWVNNSPIVRAQSSPMTVPSSFTPTNLTTLNPAGYPDDLLLVSAAFEANIGSTQFSPLTEVNYFPPDYVAGAVINYWANQAEQIMLAGCINSRLVILQYRKSLPVPVIATDSIGILFGEIFLAPRAAAIAAASVGKQDAAAALTKMAINSFAEFLLANRGQQKTDGPGMNYAGLPQSGG